MSESASRSAVAWAAPAEALPSQAPEALPRYALYWAPEPEHPLWAAGCAWLGRDPAEALAPGWRAPPWRLQPGRYGFHATLKAPIRLIEGVNEADWLAVVAELASRHGAFQMPRLQLAWQGQFLALLPARPVPAGHALRRLADACVTDLDGFRRPPGPAEQARRLAGVSSAAQRAMLARWGYPQVLALWRFHMTLSDPLPDLAAPEAQALWQQAEAALGPALAEPIWARSLCVFREPAGGGPLRLLRRLALGTGRGA